MTIKMKPLAYIRSDYSKDHLPPPQSIYNPDVTAFVEVLPEFQDAMLGLEEGNFVVITFYFHESQGYELQHIPLHGTELFGLFATRTPHRPNGIGHSVCKIKDIKHNGFSIQGVDMFNGTPVLDIKIYIPELYPQ